MQFRIDFPPLSDRCLPLLLLACLLWTPFAQAQLGAFVVTDDTRSHDLARDLEFIEDATWTMDIQEATDPETEGRYRKASSGGDVNFSFSHSAYWLRFKVMAATETPQDWLLEIRFPPLDRVEVYIPDGWGNYSVHVLGDQRPFTERIYPHRNLVLPFKLKNGPIQTVYMRVTTEGTVTLPMTLWDPIAFAQEDELSFAWLMLYLGMLFALTVYNLLLYASIKEKVYLTYAAFAASMGLAQASYSGLAFEYLWPGLPQWAHFSPPVMLVVVCFLGCVFTRSFLNTRSFPRFDRIIKTLMVAFVGSTICTVFISFRFGIHVSSLVALVGGLVAIAIGVHTCRKGIPGARYFLLAWSLLATGVVLFCLRTIGLLPLNFLTTYGLQIGSAFEMMLLALALASRINAMRREKEAAQEHALHTQEEMLAALQRKEHELEERIEHRTHELEMANRQLRENEQHLQDLVHHDPLTGLANRVLLYDRIGHALVQRRRDGGMLAILLIDLDSFKPINDRYGHAVGDHLLIAIANRFKAVVRESDTVARLGGDEFVILLESVADSASVEQIVAKLNAEAVRTFVISELKLHVAASVGFALYPHHGADAQSLLAKADAAMYAVKRKRVVREALPAGL